VSDVEWSFGEAEFWHACEVQGENSSEDGTMLCSAGSVSDSDADTGSATAMLDVLESDEENVEDLQALLSHDRSAKLHWERVFRKEEQTRNRGGSGQERYAVPHSALVKNNADLVEESDGDMDSEEDFLTTFRLHHDRVVMGHQYNLKSYQCKRILKEMKTQSSDSWQNSLSRVPAHHQVSGADYDSDGFERCSDEEEILRTRFECHPDPGDGIWEFDENISALRLQGYLGEQRVVNCGVSDRHKVSPYTRMSSKMRPKR